MNKSIFFIAAFAVVSCSGPGGGQEEKPGGVIDSAKVDTTKKKRTDMSVYDNQEIASLRQQVLECGGAYRLLEREFNKQDSIIKVLRLRGK